MLIMNFRIENRVLDAWKGAKKCANLYTNQFITKEEYLEFGCSYIKEYKCSNLFNKNT